MGYLDRLKGMNLEKCLPSPLQKPQEAPFDSFCSAQGGRFQKIAPPEQVTPTPARSCTTCAHVCRSGCCGEPVAAGLSDLEGVIRYHADGGKGCKAWQDRDPLAGAYWGYAAEDYQRIAEVTRRDPGGVRRALLADYSFRDWGKP